MRSKFKWMPLAEAKLKVRASEIPVLSKETMARFCLTGQWLLKTNVGSVGAVTGERAFGSNAGGRWNWGGGSVSGVVAAERGPQGFCLVGAN